jgi:signal transduction histidine kinase
MDATEEGGTIEVNTSLRDGWIAVEIKDDGHGIPIPQQHRIYQPYFTTKESGTGLGLFVCSRIIEQMDGARWELTHSSPAGTTFTVLLDCARLQPAPLPAAAAETAPWQPAEAGVS